MTCSLDWVTFQLILVESRMGMKAFAGVNGSCQHVVGVIAAENETEKSWEQGIWAPLLRLGASATAGECEAAEAASSIEPWESRSPRQVVKRMEREQLLVKSNLSRLA